jgi:hypothetical protein
MRTINELQSLTKNEMITIYQKITGKDLHETEYLYYTAEDYYNKLAELANFTANRHKIYFSPDMLVKIYKTLKLSIEHTGRQVLEDELLMRIIRQHKTKSEIIEEKSIRSFAKLRFDEDVNA